MDKEEWYGNVISKVKIPKVITNQWVDEYYKKVTSNEQLSKQESYERDILRIWGLCYRDLRGYDLSQLDLEHIALLSFDSSTIWPDSKHMPKGFYPEEILEKGKSPMLGFEALHKRGITGKGVVVATIDSAFMDGQHPEFKGSKIHDLSVGTGSESHFHASGVLANLCGQNVGVAPGVEVYHYGSRLVNGGFVAALYEAMKDIIKKIKSGIKICALSRSGPAPMSNEKLEEIAKSDWAKQRFGSAKKTKEYFLEQDLKQFFGGDKNLRTKYNRLLKQMESLGCKFVDSGEFGRHFSCGEYRFYDDYHNTDDIRPNYFVEDSSLVSFVCGGKVTPEFLDADGYKFEWESCYSWTIPQAVGMFALCRQVNPNLTWQEFVDISYKTSKINKNGVRVANPKTIIREVGKVKNEGVGA